MASAPKSKGNILVDPAEYASKLETLDADRDALELRRIEDHLAHRLRLGGAITYIDEDGEHVLEDKNGVRPFEPGTPFPAPPECAELTIRELACQHGVHADRDALDDWCEAVTAHAGDDVQSDEVEQLVIGLRRKKALSGIELTKLHARYLEERFNS